MWEFSSRNIHIIWLIWVSYSDLTGIIPRHCMEDRVKSGRARGLGDIACY